MTMKFSTLRYNIEEAFVSLFRNGLMSISSIATVAACVFIILLSFIVAGTVEYSVANLEETIGMSIFVKDELTPDEVTKLREAIEKVSHVESVYYVSKEEALIRFKEEMGEFSEILDYYERSNPLPRSFDITLDDNENTDEVLKALNKEEIRKLGIDEIQHAKSISEPLLSLNRMVRVASLVLVFLLILLSVVIIMNTIKLTVNNRSREIGIMKFVGATDAFIKGPFIIEGIIIGLIGAIIPIILGWILYSPLVKQIVTNMPVAFSGLFVFRTSGDIFPIFVPFGLLFGALLGAVGSWTSVRRYLEV